MNIGKLANGYLVIGVIIAAMWPVMLSLAKNVNIYEFLFFENVIAVVASLFLIAAVGKLESLKGVLRDKRNLSIIAFVAILEYVIPDFGMLLGEHYISASLASIIFRTYPILMLLFLPIVLKERTTKYQLAALVLAFVGIVVVIYPGSGALLLNNAWIGILLVFMVALSTAISLTVMKRYVHETESALFLYNLIGLIVFTSLFVANGMPLQAVDSSGWIAILYAAILYSVVSAYGLYYVLKLLKTTAITNLFYFAPFLTFIFANSILGEPISFYYVIAAGLIASGLLIQKFDKAGGSYASQKSSLKPKLIFDVTGAFVRTEEREIASLIRSGGRAFAVKMSKAHASIIGEVAKTRSPKIITRSENKFASELEFIEEVLGVKADEMAVVVVGDTADCEEAMGVISSKLVGG